MVDLARAHHHHPNNCFQDNRNHFDDSNVATTAKETPTSARASAAAVSNDFLSSSSSFCIINDAITTTIDSIGFMAFDRGIQMQCQQQQQQQRQHRNGWQRCIKNHRTDIDTNSNNDSINDSDCHRRHPCHSHRHHHRAPIFQCNGMQKKKNSTGALSRAHGIIVNSSNLSNLLILFAVLSLLLLKIDVINAEPQQPIKSTTSTTTAKLLAAKTAAAAAAAAATTKTTAAAATEQQCEPKVLDETPPDPVS